jgi:hypothetical protein
VKNSPTLVQQEASSLKRQLLAERIEQVEGPETAESKGRQQPWCT